ncbi:ABC transporter permease [Chryseolinea sp. Jin1]|uniref:ABC transporter permease n=2 Tax=Chryseolinea lacunae TaxID=2801331 RepID=A0ABS1L2Z8_9BACT|nr:ABC transporter permease [Chryseolinea lacunae]
MLKNYFTIALRNLSKHRFYTFINITGLAIGIASCLIITLYISQDLSFDKHFANADRIYRLDSETHFNGNHFSLAVAPPLAAPTLLHDYPEIEATANFRQWGWRRVRRTTDNIKEQYTVFGSNGIFKTFSLPLLHGNAANALTEPNTVVMSRSKAEQYFPGENPIGQTLIIDNKDNYKVTGVFEDFPATTHFKFDFIFAMPGLEDSKDNSWLSSNFNTYILLRNGASPKDLEAKFPKMVETYIGPQVKSFFGNDFSMQDFAAKGNKIQYMLTPLLSIHLHSDKTGELGTNSDITYVYLFGAVAFFILTIACINFMNLSTARSANRAKEVGVRKVLGSLRSHLVRQFLMESILLSFFSFMIALAIVYLVLPAFNVLAERNLVVPITPLFVATLVLAALVIGLLAGIYPSLFLSAFKPVNVLKGKVALGMKSGAVRSSLVVFQFMISIFLVIGTITVTKQMDFIQNKKLGFKKDQVIILHNAELLENQHETFRNEMLKVAGITNVSVAGFLPIAGWGRNDNSFWPYGKQPSQENLISMQNWAVDTDYISTLGMEIVQGRDFSRAFPSDSTAIILNESAVKRYGFKDPIGEKIVTGNNGDFGHTITYTVIGVMRDFHFESLKQNITPLGIHLGKSGWSMSIRFASSNTASVIQDVEKTWKKFQPGQPFEYTFLDQAFGKMYTAEKRLERLFGIFAALAIMIACLGLFALTAFTAEQRTKEIGIRKVLGASVASIVLLLSKEFGKLIVISFILAAPLSWYAVNRWLENYTYKTEIGIAVYLFAGAAAFLVAWLTMGFQSVKAARSNPVNSLRSE